MEFPNKKKQQLWTNPSLNPSIPSKKLDYILNSREYFYVTYVMHYMIITYFYSLKIFLCKGWLCQNSEYADQKGAREGVSQSRALGQRDFT